MAPRRAPAPIAPNPAPHDLVALITSGAVDAVKQRLPADLDSLLNNGLTPLLTAIQARKDDVALAILDKGASPTSDALVEALKECSGACAKSLIGKLQPSDLQAKHGGDSLLRVALKAMASTKRNHVPLMKEVVDNLWSYNDGDGSWDEKDGDGNTILHLLAAACYYERFKKLTSNGFTKDMLTVKNGQNQTPAEVAETCFAGTAPWELQSAGSRRVPPRPARPKSPVDEGKRGFSGEPCHRCRDCNKNRGRV